MRDTGLPTESREGFAPWHPVHGFDYDAMRRERQMIDVTRGEIADGWRVVPVTITITAKAAPVSVRKFVPGEPASDKRDVME